MRRDKKLGFDRVVTLGAQLILLIFVFAFTLGYFNGSNLSRLEALAAYFPLKCPLHFLTGIACPTCGLGHALISISSGQIKTSWQHHPLGIPIYLLLLIVLLAFATKHQRQLKIIVDQLYRFFKTQPTLIRIIVGIYVVWGFFRHI